MSDMIKIKRGEPVSTAVDNANSNFSALKSEKVDKTTTIAGVDLADNITASELRTGLDVYSTDEVEQYVAENGGKIDKIQKNGTDLEIVEKVVNITVPTTASDVSALPDSTKYGASLSVSGTSVQLKDQDGNNLGSAITTQDTDTGATSVDETGSGNAYTGSSYDETTRKITFTKGSTFLTQHQDISGKLDKKPDGTNDLIVNNKLSTTYIPDYILGQLLYGGNVSTGAVATLTTNAKTKLGTTDNSITLTNDTTAVTGYTANEGIYYIASTNLTFAGLNILTGDWLISKGTAWDKIDNTDAITGVKGNAEVTYRTGNVNLTPDDLDDTDSSNKFVSASDKSSWNGAVSTIGGYGDIVSHDADEFATATQGGKADTAVQPSDLATVATSGSYSDLLNLPTLPNGTYIGTSTNWGTSTTVSYLRTNYFSGGQIPQKEGDLVYSTGTRNLHRCGAVTWDSTENCYKTTPTFVANFTIPSALSQLLDDSTHRVVTDTEKSAWNKEVGILRLI